MDRVGGETGPSGRRALPCLTGGVLFHGHPCGQPTSPPIEPLQTSTRALPPSKILIGTQGPDTHYPPATAPSDPRTAAIGLQRHWRSPEHDAQQQTGRPAKTKLPFGHGLGYTRGARVLGREQQVGTEGVQVVLGEVRDLSNVVTVGLTGRVLGPSLAS